MRFAFALRTQRITVTRRATPLATVFHVSLSIRWGVYNVEFEGVKKEVAELHRLVHLGLEMYDVFWSHSVRLPRYLSETP